MMTYCPPYNLSYHQIVHICYIVKVPKDTQHMHRIKTEELDMAQIAEMDVWW